MNSIQQRLPAYLLAIVGHAAAIAAVGIGTIFLCLPLRHVEGVVSRLYSVPELWDMSAVAIALHFGIAACIWAIIVIIYQLIMLRIREGKAVKTVKLSRGSVITETLVVMPVFLLLVFGMAQMTVNSLGGILANVAAYEAARAAWVWMPEEQASRMGTASGTAQEKCKIAVAFTMLPVAPGDALMMPTLDSNFADRARLLAIGANIPLSGVGSEFIGSEITDALALVLSAGEVNPITGLSYAGSLDASSFVARTARKFTRAYLGSGCTINAQSHQVTMTYEHYNAMPVVARIFGEKKLLDGPGMTPGYYSTYTRTLGFTRQVAAPNQLLPSNSLRGGAPEPEIPSGLDDTDPESTLNDSIDNSG